MQAENVTECRSGGRQIPESGRLTPWTFKVVPYYFIPLSTYVPMVWVNHIV